MMNWTPRPGRGTVLVGLPRAEVEGVPDDAITEVDGAARPASFHLSRLPGSARYLDQVVAKAGELGISQVSRALLVADHVTDAAPGAVGSGALLGQVELHPLAWNAGFAKGAGYLLENAHKQYAVRITSVGDRAACADVLYRFFLPMDDVGELLDTLPVDIPFRDESTATVVARRLEEHGATVEVGRPNLPPGFEGASGAVTAALQDTLAGDGARVATVLTDVPDVDVWVSPQLAEALRCGDVDAVALAVLRGLVPRIAASPLTVGAAVPGLEGRLQWVAVGDATLLFDRRPFLLSLHRA
jgi:hypothetical protein